MAAFAELALWPELVRAVEDLGWQLPTPVQAEAIPLILGGSDVCAAAETGSGKTAAFSLPALQLIHEGLRGVAVTDAAPSTAESVSADGSDSAGWENDVSDKDPQVIAEFCPQNREVKLASFDTARWRGFRGKRGLLTPGSYMFEVTVESGLCRVGFTTSAGERNLGMDAFSFGFGGTGKKSWNRVFTDYGPTFGEGDTVACVLQRYEDPSECAGVVSFFLNGKSLGDAFRLNPDLQKVALVPGVCGRSFKASVRYSNFRFPLNEVSAFAEVPLVTAQTAKVSAPKGGGPLCICLEPTRDLVFQTEECFRKFGKHLSNPPVFVEAVVGGQGSRPAARGNVEAHVVVGTVEKVLALVRRGSLRLDALQLLIIDEADEVVREEGLKNVLDLQETCCRKLGRAPQTLFFSATLRSPLAVEAIAALAPNASWVDLRGKETLPDATKVCVYSVDPRQGLLCQLPGTVPAEVETDQVHLPATVALTKQKRLDEETLVSMHLAPDARAELLSCRIKQLKLQALICLADAFKMESCWVVCRTNLDCDIVQRFLIQAGGGKKSSGPMETGKENPYSCVVVASQRSQQERTESLKAFKSGGVRFLVCTDAAARGIDAPNVPYLIMLTLPEEPAKFFHRVGRVGRAQCLGLAICLVSTVKEKVWFHTCGNKNGQCTDRRLCSEGGCTIWYDEPQLLRDIEGAIGSELPRLDASTFHCEGIADPFKVLEAAAAETRRRRGKASQPSQPVYGRTAEEASASSQKNTEEIAASVRRLRSLESEMQKHYLVLAELGLS